MPPPPAILPFPEPWVDDVDDAAEESFDPFELTPDDDDKLLLDNVPLEDDDALVLLLFVEEGIADAPGAEAAVFAMWLGLPPALAAPAPPVLVLFADRSPTGRLSRDLSIVAMETVFFIFFSIELFYDVLIFSIEFTFKVDCSQQADELYTSVFFLSG